MKKIQKFVLVLLAASVVMLTSCGTKDDDDDNKTPATPAQPAPTYDVQGTYTNTFPFDTQDQTEGQWEENACGAFCMAYYLAIKGFIPKDKIKEFTQTFYNKVKFDASAGLGDYSDPRKIVTEIAPYVQNAELRMNINGTENAELILAGLVDSLNISDEDIVDADDFSAQFDNGEYVIEIVVPHHEVNMVNPSNNDLHYVLTYKKGNTLYTVDTFSGTEVPRADIEYCFCNGGIFLTPKN